jgi:hypothetical protein
MRLHYLNTLFILIFLLMSKSGYTQYNEQYSKQILTGERKSINQLLDLIESECDIIINYSPGQIHLGKIIDFEKRELEVIEVLKIISIRENLDLIINGNNTYLIRNLTRNQIDDTEISLSGYLKDFETGEALIGATIRTSDLKNGQFSDNKGYFNLKIPKQTDTVFISYIGYSQVTITGKYLRTGILGDLYLKRIIVLNEVIINESIQRSEPELRDFQRQKSAFSLHENILKYGISDVFNELIMKPGINKINDFQGGMSVNGSSPGDNIYYLDGIRIFEPNHIFGLFSSFSSKPINNISLFSNFIPLSYSGAFSSVMDFHTRDGNTTKHEFEIGISNSAANFFVTGPLKKHTTSYFIDYRHSLLDLYLPKIIRKYNDINFQNMFFNDINVKINHKINQFNRISAFFYQGKDHVNISNNSKKFLNTENDFSWLNRTTGIFWTFIYDDDLKSDLSISLAGYSNNSFSDFRLQDTGVTKQYLNIFSSTRIRDISLKHDFMYYLKRSRIKFGYNFSKFNLSPVLGGYISPTNNENISIEHEKDSIVNNSMAYLSGEYALSRYIDFKAGIQFGSVFYKNFKNPYLNPQIAISFKAAKSLYFDLAYSRTNKFIHSLGSYAVGIPSMLWVTSGKDTPVSVMDNMSLNIMCKTSSFSIRGELYYRIMRDILMYRNNIEAYNPIASKSALVPLFNINLSVPENIASGEGISYGFNLLTQFELSVLESSLSFSINKIDERFDELNRGDWFAGKFDLDYSFSAAINYKLKKTNLFANWSYHCGQVFTLPNYIINSSSGEEILDFSVLNNARLGNYHSLDLGINYKIEFKKMIIKTSTGISNIYNHFNPVYAYIFKENNVYKVSQVGGIPVNPYISFETKF